MTHNKTLPLCVGAHSIPPSPLMLDNGNNYYICSECGEPCEQSEHNQSSKDEETLGFLQLLEYLDSWYHHHTRHHLIDVDPNAKDMIDGLLKKINSEKQKSEQTIKLHRQEAHLAGRIEEAQSVLSGYTTTYGASSILNSVLKKRIKKYRKQLQDIFTEHNREALKQTKEETL